MPPALRLATAAMLSLMAAMPGLAQTKAASKGPALSASQRVMAGSMLSILVSRAPSGARLAIARPDDPADRAIIVLSPAAASSSAQTPGEAGRYELRLTVDKDGLPAILLRQPLETTIPGATLAAPDRVGHGQALPVRGIGPNGERDRVVLVPSDAPIEAQGPFFFPHENVEATLEAPDQPGAYELRYIMDAPLTGPRILARRAVVVL